MKQATLTILLCVAFTILFGVLHNQVSARVSLEYFTIGHRALIHSTSPTLMGIAWGIHSTWWVGVALGLVLVLSGMAGGWEKRTARSFIRPLVLLFCFCAMASGVMGILGYRLSSGGSIFFLEGISQAVSPERQPRYMAALWMHTASYSAAAMGAAVLGVRTLFGRRRASRL